MTTPWILLFVGIATSGAVAGDFSLTRSKTGLSIRSETVLSGLDVYKSTIEQVIAKLGSPDQITFAPRSERALATRISEWETRDCILSIATVNESGSKNSIMRIDVWGHTPNAEVGTTGRGLKLGDTIGDARRIYGLRLYFGVTLPENKGSPLVAGAGEYAPTLEIDFDNSGRVNHMSLTNLCVIACY